MNSGYVDKNLINNSTLSCFILAVFVREYESREDYTSPELLKLLLVIPIVWSEESCKAIKNRNFASSLHGVLADCPLIKNQFEERLAEYSTVTLQGLNLACATGLLEKLIIDEEPYIASTFSQWPRGSKPSDIAPEMLSTIKRLAVWFRNHNAAQLYSLFLGI